MRTGLSGFALSRTELAVQIREPATPGRKAASAAFVHDDAASSKLTVNAIKKPGFYCPAFFRSYLIRPIQALMGTARNRSEEHTSELQSLMRTSYAVSCLKTKNNQI